MKPRPTALIIDSDRAIRKLLIIALERERYKVLEAADGQSGMRIAVDERLDVIILELDLPDVSGVTVLRHIRAWNRTPVLVLSERAATMEKIGAFDAGANDYLTKPFDTDELLVRLRVLQRCVPGIPDGPLLIRDGFRINLATHEVTFRGERLALTPTEEAVLYLLLQHVGKIVTCEHILCAVWGGGSAEKIHDLHVHITWLRQKLAVRAGEISVRTEGGIGYSLRLNSQADGFPVAATSVVT